MNISKDNKSFSERHPVINMFIGLLILTISVSIACFIIYNVFTCIGSGITGIIDWIKNTLTKIDAVIVVSLVTGAVSITGVVISSIISKVLDSKQRRRDYLNQKREEPYCDFINMVYKIQESSKQGKEYSQNDMLTDMYKFSRSLTLWGSNDVVKLWTNYRTEATKLEGTANLLFLEKILYAMRKDMGHKKMKKGIILSFFVNDFKESYKIYKEQKRQ